MCKSKHFDLNPNFLPLFRSHVCFLGANRVGGHACGFGITAAYIIRNLPPGRHFFIGMPNIKMVEPRGVEPLTSTLPV